MLDPGLSPIALRSTPRSAVHQDHRGVVAAEILKSQVRQTVRKLRGRLRDWIAANAEIASRVVGIDSDAQVPDPQRRSECQPLERAAPRRARR